MGWYSDDSTCCEGDCLSSYSGILIDHVESILCANPVRQVHVRDIQLLDLNLELLDENPEDLQLSSLGRGFVTIDNALGVNMGREMNYDVSLFSEYQSEDKVKIGSCRITLCLDVDKAVSELSADRINLETFEIHYKKSALVKVNMSIDKLVENNENNDDNEKSTNDSDAKSDEPDQIVRGSDVGEDGVMPGSQSSSVPVSHTSDDDVRATATVDNSVQATRGASSDGGDRVISLRSLVR